MVKSGICFKIQWPNAWGLESDMEMQWTRSMKFKKDGSSSQFIWFCGCVFYIEMNQTIFEILWIIQNVGF